MQSPKSRFYLIVSFAILVFLSACKKELDVIKAQPSLEGNNTQLLKNWYEQQMSTIENEGGKDDITLKRIKKQGTPAWEKTILHEGDNSFITPINFDKKHLTKYWINKYLITLMDEKGLIRSGSYMYVISKDSSSISRMLKEDSFILPERKNAEEDFSGTYINYDFNNNLISSKNYEKGQLTNKQDKLKIKFHPKEKNNVDDEGPPPSVANPNEEGCSFITIDWYWQTYVNGVLVSEEYVYSTNEWACPGGGGGGYTPPTDTLNTPCKHADTLAMNAEFKAKFDSLKNKTSINKEFGYYYKNTTANNIDETVQNGNDNEKYIDFTVPAGEQIDGFMHSHFTNTLSIFSMSDLFSMCDLYVKNKMKDPKKFTAAVVTSNGTQYLLKIDNLAAFQTFAARNTPNSIPIESLNDMLKINSSNSVEDNEIRFLQLLQLGNSGLKLFKGNNTFTNWQPKKLGANNTMVNAPCN